MAVERGGRADKLGNRYEGFWVARNLLRVLVGEAVAVTVEAVGEDEDGVDLWVDYLDGKREAHQCKRKNRNYGKWTPGELSTRAVLSRLGTQLRRGAHYRFLFVSGHDAPELRALCELARTTGNDCSSFWKAADSTRDSAAALRTFCTATGLNPDAQSDRSVAYDLLQRSDVRVFDGSPAGRQDIELLARLCAVGSPEAVVALLANFAHDRLGHALHADEIRAYLRGQKVPPRDLTGEPTLAPGIELLREQFQTSLRPTLIGGAMIPRGHTRQVRNALFTAGNRLVVVHGRAGLGKSGVLLALADQLAAEGVPFLPLRLDRRTPQDGARQYGTNLCGLPDSPALSLRALAGDREAVLILDQLDAIRWSAAHGRASWEACQEVMDEALLLPRLRVVVACRTFDLRDDQLIRAWLTRHRGVEVEVGDLPEDDVERVVGQEGGTYRSLSPAQCLLLRSPLCLSLWVQLARGGTPPTSFTTASGLMRDFWRMRRRQLHEMGVSGAETEAALAELVNRMDRSGSAQAPERLLDRYPRARDALLSLSLITAGDGRVTFAHQAFFEHLFATRLLDEISSGKETIRDWLKRHDQSLFRRNQLRQLLALQRDESPRDYLASVSGLLSDPTIRFHLKHLVLRFLGDVPRPTAQEVECVLGLFRDPAWREHVAEAVLWGKAPWFGALHDCGFLAEKLAAGVEADQVFVLHLARTVADACGNRVAALLAPYENAPDPWPFWISQVLVASDGSEDTRALYDLRLRSLVRSGYAYPPRFPSQLVGSEPGRCVEWIEARLRREVVRLTHPSPEGLGPSPDGPFDLNIHEVDTLTRLAATAPREVCGRLLPLLVCLSELTRCVPHDWAPGEFYPDAFWSQAEDRRRLLEPLDLVAAVGLAGAILAVGDPGFLGQQLRELSGDPSRTVQRLLARVLLLCPDSAADTAINWLCDQPGRFSLGGAEPDRWSDADALIRRFGAACSAEVYARLEAALLDYHDALEYRNLLWERATVEAGHAPETDWYGLAQHALLPSLPGSRVSRQASAAMAQWREKFGADALQFIRWCDGGVYSHVLPLSAEQARQMTDEHWLEIIDVHSVNLGLGQQRQVDENHVTTHDAHHYAQVLGALARRQPGRCADLALRFPAVANPQYLLAVLYALGERKAPDPENPGGWEPATPEQVARLAAHVGYREDRGMALAWCQLVRGWPEVRWPSAVLDTLRRYATEHPDPSQTLAPVPFEGGMGLEASSLSCVRAVAAGAIQAILFDHPDLYEFFLPTVEQIVTDPSPPVRVAATGVCLPILNCDRARAVDLFLRACDGEDAVLACRAVNHFLSWTLRDFPEQLGALVRRMVGSLRAEVAQYGAQWVTVGWLHGRQTAECLQACSRSDRAEHRLGVADVAAQSLAEENLIARAAELVGPFFDDPDRRVRQAATASLLQGRILGVAPVPALADRHVRSLAFRDVPTVLLQALGRHDGSLVPLADVVFAVCDVFCGPFARASRDIQERRAYDVTFIPPLLLRLYEQAEQASRPDLQTRCLDAWDGLLQARVGSARDLLLSLDR